MEVGGQRHAKAAIVRKVSRYPLHRRLGGPVWRRENVFPSLGFKFQTVQTVASRSTYGMDYSIINKHQYVHLTFNSILV